VIIIRICFVDDKLIQRLVFVGRALLSMFDHYNQTPLAVDIIVQRLDINGALGVLGWVKPLFEDFFIMIYFIM